jgi:hypothetical protein
MFSICLAWQSEDEEVRRHAVRALGNAMWNGYVEQRVLVWDVNRCDDPRPMSSSISL